MPASLTPALLVLISLTVNASFRCTSSAQSWKGRPPICIWRAETIKLVSKAEFVLGLFFFSAGFYKFFTSAWIMGRERFSSDSNNWIISKS